MIDSYEKVSEFYTTNEANRLQKDRVLTDDEITVVFFLRLNQILTRIEWKLLEIKELSEILVVKRQQLDEFFAKMHQHLEQNDNEKTIVGSKAFSLQDYLACFECTNKSDEEFRIVIKHNLNESEKQSFGTDMSKVTWENV